MGEEYSGKLTQVPILLNTTFELIFHSKLYWSPLGRICMSLDLISCGGEGPSVTEHNNLHFPFIEDCEQAVLQGEPMAVLLTDTPSQ